MSKWVFTQDCGYIKEGTIVSESKLREIVSVYYDFFIQTGINHNATLKNSIISLVEWRDKQIDSIFEDD